MAVRKIVRIDEQKCNGCGQCIVDCPEGALKLVDGKARVVKESYCDGLGACIGACPVDAITIEEREAEAFDEEAVKQNMAAAAGLAAGLPLVPFGCPGAAARPLERAPDAAAAAGSGSQLTHWPVQLTLVSPTAPFLREADLLLVADCVPFAMSDFHGRILQGRAIVVGCPKLDDASRYVAKLADIFRQSAIRSLSIVRMEVPCCGGLCHIAKKALESSGRAIPLREVTVGVNGQVLSEQAWQEGSF
jgi:Fe-S-cluster-containing hydrogenase component 2